MDNDILAKIVADLIGIKVNQQETERFQDLLIELIADIYDKLEDLGVSR